MIVYGITAEQAVALLAEGVDRNDGYVKTIKDMTRRPPRGGRG